MYDPFLVRYNSLDTVTVRFKNTKHNFVRLSETIIQSTWIFSISPGINVSIRDDDIFVDSVFP